MRTVVGLRDATIRLRATEPSHLETLGSELARLLNRPGEPAVVVEAAEDVLTFESPTWGPILKARVDDAMDDLLGTAWRFGFAQDGETQWT
jgi:hypothetical protein